MQHIDNLLKVASQYLGKQWSEDLIIYGPTTISYTIIILLSFLLCILLYTFFKNQSLKEDLQEKNTWVSVLCLNNLVKREMMVQPGSLAARNYSSLQKLIGHLSEFVKCICKML